jgi:hypothetical protein
MPRVIGPNVTNSVEIKDAVTGDIITLEYRTPRTKERVDYQANAFKVSGKGRKAKLESNQVEMRQFYGAKILTGIEEGAFIYQDESGEKRPLDSSVKGFQKILLAHAPEVIEALAIHAFEGTYALASEEESDAEDGDPDNEDGEEDGESGEA